MFPVLIASKKLGELPRINYVKKIRNMIGILD